MLHFGLIGYPLAHSFSPDWFRQKFETESIEAEYKTYPLNEISLLKSLIVTQHLSGINVTIPYKEKVIPLLDETDEKARRVGSVNCIKINGAKLKGYNTDIEGFEKSFLSILPKDKKYKALIFGSGGSAKTVAFCLRERGIPFLMVSRNEILNGITYDELTPEVMAAHLLLINTTPVGMYPDETAKLPLPFHLVSGQHIAFDLIYNPDKTTFLHACEKQGAVIKNGIEMLQVQAEASFRIFMNKEY